MRAMTDWRWSTLALLLCVWAPGAPAAAVCEKDYPSTFTLIQGEIFEKRGCTSSACHGEARSGGLDLRAASAFAALVDAPVTSVAVESHPGLQRVVPARKDESLLWLNLAAATLPGLWKAPLRSMPLGLAPLTLDALDVIRLWIEHGAPRDGVVPGTAALLDACLPPSKPLRTEPLAPPAAGAGVQLRAPHQVLAPQSEREVCFVSYYDFSDRVPAEVRSPNGRNFRYKRVDARQDPLSHHLVAIAYTGRATIHDPRWGAFTCKQGAHDGQACEPTDPASCGAEGICGSEPMAAVGCNGFGPGDAGIGFGETSLFNTMASAASVDGVYDEAPLKGIVVWNAHAFNIWDEPAHLDAWINFAFAFPAEQRRERRRFVDVTAITKMRAPAYGTDEVCHYHRLPPATQLVELSSHVHERGRRFRIFQGEFICDGGPNDGDPCSPFGPDPGLPSPDLCAGAPCTSKVPPAVGDCNGDLDVSIDELVTGVRIALGQAAIADCARFDGDGNGNVSIDELVAAVQSAVNPALRDPSTSLLYVSLTYSDPLVLSLDPPLELGGRLSPKAQRTLTYCALYDNGATNPDEVKRLSRIPPNAAACEPTHCAEGRVGEPCGGATDNAACDSQPGSSDGACDACTVGFGVSTDDEMFVLTGSYIDK